MVHGFVDVDEEDIFCIFCCFDFFLYFLHEVRRVYEIVHLPVELLLDDVGLQCEQGSETPDYHQEAPSLPSQKLKHLFKLIQTNSISIQISNLKATSIQTSFSLCLVLLIKDSLQFCYSCLVVNGQMKVVVRVRPLSNKENEQIQIYEEFIEGKKRNSKRKLSPQIISFYSKYRNVNAREILKIDDNTISVYDQEYKNSEKKMKDYTYSDVFGEYVSNAAIFESTVMEGAEGAMEGFNCTVLAYGITGSGKTYSIFGHPKLEKDRGMCYLAYQYLLKKKQELERSNASVKLKFSFLQIYNENIRDLLSEDHKQQVLLGEDTKGNTQLIDSNQIEIFSIEQVVSLISLGSARRSSAATAFNLISSRSHAILKMSIEIIKDEQKMSSKLFIIDLAGSEKINNDNLLRKTEGVNINKSLLTLGNCINALAQNTKKPGISHIPYRDSKLTRLLKDSLGGNVKIIMIACISPNPFALEETITTLNYAERAKGIKKEITRNVVSSEPQCPKCHCQLPAAKAQPFKLEKQPVYHASEQFVEMQAISSDFLLRLYQDIIDNARQLQKLERLKSIMNQPCEQLDIVFAANENQKIVLKNTLLNIFQSKIELNKERESSKPKKKIRLSSSSKKGEKGKDPAECQKENAVLTEYNQDGKVYNETDRERQVKTATNFYIPEESRPIELKLKTQENIDENRMSTISLRKKRSKVEIIKKPPISSQKRSSSDRIMTQYPFSNFE